MTQTPQLFNRQKLTRYAQKVTGQDDFVSKLVLSDLQERLGLITRKFENAVFLAPFAHQIPTSLVSAEGEIRYESQTTSDWNEISDDNDDNFELGENRDLIISLFDLAILNNVPGFLNAAHRALRADGLFIAAFVGGMSLTELRQSFLTADALMHDQAITRVAPMIDTKEAGSLLQKTGFALPVVDAETHMVRYESPLKLIREVQTLGASNPMALTPKKPMTRTHLGAAMSHYQDNFADPDGRVRATLEIIWMSGWSPHQSQQKPLKPGSAQTLLSDALKDRSAK